MVTGIGFGAGFCVGAGTGVDVFGGGAAAAGFCPDAIAIGSGVVRSGGNTGVVLAADPMATTGGVTSIDEEASGELINT